MDTKVANNKHFKKIKQLKSRVILGALLVIMIISFLQLYGLFMDMSSYEKNLSSTNDGIQDLRQELNATNNGLEETFQDIQHLKNRSKYNLHNPTYEEAYNFILNDTTDVNTYNDSSYNCAHFSRDVNNNAEKQGMRTAYVEITLRWQPHAIVAFNTTDRGLVFFEPQSDELVELEIGKDYWAECVVADSPGYDYNPFNIVESFTLYW